MQIINSYSTINKNFSRKQEFRLYHMSRPAVKRWRKTRSGRGFQTNIFERWFIDSFSHYKVTAVDFAGWYLESFGFDVQCVESSEISKLYYPNCHIEHDLATWRPDYVDTDRLVLFNHPGFLKYMTFNDFINFLRVWVKSPVMINFNTRLIQHNHLKYNLIDLVREQVDFNIEQLFPNVWLLRP